MDNSTKDLARTSEVALAPYKLREPKMYAAERFARLVFRTQPPPSTKDWVAIVIAVTVGAGISIASLVAWLTSHTAPFLGVLLGIVSLCFLGLARGARQLEARALAEFNEERIWLVAKLKDEAKITAEQAEKTAEQAIRASIEQQERTRLAVWTPDVIVSCVTVQLETVTFFDLDVDTRRPVVYLKWIVTCSARVACDVVIRGARCEIFTLPSPGKHVCGISVPGFIVEFDGNLSPGAVSVHREQREVLSPEQFAALRAELTGSSASTAKVVIDATVKTATGNAPIQQDRPIQCLIATPPWLLSRGNGE